MAIQSRQLHPLFVAEITGVDLRTCGPSTAVEIAAALERHGVLVFRGDGVQKDEKIGAQWLTVAAQRGNAVAQNRLARLYAAGKGVPLNQVEAAKWHLVARDGGKADPELDQLLDKLSPGDREKAEEQAKAFKPVAAAVITSSAAPKFGPRRIK